MNRTMPQTDSPPNDAHQSRHAADRLIDAITRQSAPVCVGIDPVYERLPAALQSQHTESEDRIKAIADYCEAVLDAVAGCVPCVKFQSACFERYGASGVAALGRQISIARKLGLQVVLDAKRGDIDISADHYRAAVFDRGASSSDWLTVSPYLGADSVAAFLTPGAGIFALVRTSNPGSDALQGLSTADGCSLACVVADMVAELGAQHIGESGYSSVGAVVGATKPADARELRARMSQQIFLVPGFGAQGGSVDDILPCFNTDGLGAIVSASRSVIYAFDRDDPRWPASVGDAAAKLADDVGNAVGMRRGG